MKRKKLQLVIVDAVTGEPKYAECVVEPGTRNLIVRDNTPKELYLLTSYDSMKIKKTKVAINRDRHILLNENSVDEKKQAYVLVKSEHELQQQRIDIGIGGLISVTQINPYQITKAALQRSLDAMASAESFTEQLAYEEQSENNSLSFGVTKTLSKNKSLLVTLIKDIRRALNVLDSLYK